MHLSPVLVEIIITPHPNTESKCIHFRNSMIKTLHVLCRKNSLIKIDGFNLSHCAKEEASTHQGLLIPCRIVSTQKEKGENIGERDCHKKCVYVSN